MNEHDALTVLDRRMTEASAELRRAVDEAIGNPPAARPTTTLAARPGEGGVGLAPPIMLERSAAPARPHRRWMWAAAAAVVAFAGVVGIVIVGGGKDKDNPPATTEPQPFLVPGWLPSGWGPQSAARGAALPGRPSSAAVYGSSSAEDPWAGNVVAVVVNAGPASAPGAEAVEIAGHAGTVARDGETLVIAVPVGRQVFTVTGRGFDQDALVRIAAAVVEGQPIEPVLPPGLVELARGSLDIGTLPPTGGVSLVYGADRSGHSVTIAQRPGQASEIGLLRLVLPAPNTMTDIEVHGQRGVLITGDSFGSMVQWVEPPGLLVSVWAEGLGDEELTTFVEAMRPSTDAEIDDLVTRYHESPDVTDDLQEGEVVVATGDRGAVHWWVTAREHAGSVDVSYEDESSGFGFGVSPAPGSAPALDVGTSDTVDELGERVVIGAADPTVARVVVEAPGQPPLPVELYRPDELTQTVIVGFVPEAYEHGEVVGLDANGRELARTPLEQ